MMDGVPSKVNVLFTDSVLSLVDVLFTDSVLSLVDVLFTDSVLSLVDVLFTDSVLSWVTAPKLQEDELGTKDEIGSSNIHLHSSNLHLDLVPQEILVMAPKLQEEKVVQLLSV